MGPLTDLTYEDKFKYPIVLLTDCKHLTYRSQDSSGSFVNNDFLQVREEDTEENIQLVNGQEDSVDNVVMLSEVDDERRYVLDENMETMEHYSSESFENGGSNNQAFTLVCNLCCETFVDRKAVITHVLHCHNASKSRFKYKKTTKSKENLTCFVCSQILSTKRNLIRHMALHRDDKPYKCKKCDAKFVRSDYLKRHRRTHVSSKTRYTCSLCGISYEEKCNLYKHVVRMHGGPKPYSCDTCGACFARKDYLKKHIVGHTKEKAFDCTICLTSFNDKSSLREHLSIHTGVRPFVCDICGITFRIRKILTRHRLRHTGEKPFKCTSCVASFTRKYLLTEHMQKSECKVCGDVIKCKSGYKEHRKNHRLKRRQCRVCGKQFKDRKSLGRHLNTHDENPYICAICEAVYHRRRPFVVHVKNHEGIKVKSEPTMEEIKVKCEPKMEEIKVKTEIQRELDE